MNEHNPLVVEEPFVPLTDFSKPVLIAGDENPSKNSDDEDELGEIPSQMKFDMSTSDILDYNEYKQFYAEEIEGKFHRRQQQISLEKAKKRAKLGLDQDEEGGEGEGDGQDKNNQSADPENAEEKKEENQKEETEEEKTK